VCGPVLFVASILKIPTVIHESNSYPGVTTRMLAKRATRIFIAFEDAKRWLKRTDHVTLIGTPTREILGTVSASAGREFFQIDPNKKTLFVFGGSLGAASVNNTVLETLDDLLNGGIQLIWQTGQTDFERVRTAIGIKAIGWLGAFIDKIEYAFGAADLVVCRAGATTLAELTRVGKPAIIIPYPHAAGDHQTRNARSLVEAGAAVMIADQDARQKLKLIALGLLNDPGRLETMGKISARLGKPEAGRAIAASILEMIR
jgi:UDP-N-acetylglucosamine--N-acetylmuramyl-(pentapeptide) pyrophosphoryl-undecaprenol N-acetylglucosamine transferase